MLRYVLRRPVAAIPTLVGVATVVFLLLRLLPGGTARVLAGLRASEEDVERIRRGLGLDQPLLVQYGVFMGRLLQLNLGTSARTSQPVTVEVLDRLPSTMQLAVISVLLALVVGIVAGVVA